MIMFFKLHKHLKLSKTIIVQFIIFDLYFTDYHEKEDNKKIK